MSEKNRENENIEKVETAKKIASHSRANTNTSENGIGASIFRFFRFLSSLVDKLIFSRKHLGIVSLLLALLLYAVVNYDSEDSVLASNLSSSRTLSNVTVTARYNDDSFELTGLPESCTVVITGDATNVTSASTKTGYCTVDLEGYTEGTYSVPLSASGYGNSVNLTVTPTDATITLKRKTTAQFNLDYDFVNLNQMDSRYVLGEPEFEGDTDKVNIRASQDTLNSIAMVKALIDVSGQTSDFETSAPLVAYDSSGNVVNAEMDPSSVNVKVSVSSPNKVVPIEIVFEGDAPTGFAIDSITTDHQTTVIYGSEEVLASIDEVNVVLDASTLVSDTEIIQPIVLPSGVTSSEVTNVAVTATLTPVATRTIENVPINYRNNDNNYAATDVETAYVDVVVSGSEDNIAKVTADQITVYIDVADLEPGTYDLPLNIEFSANQFVKCSLTITELHITLVDN